jgi:hypothetical protein
MASVVRLSPHQQVVVYQQCTSFSTSERGAVHDRAENIVKACWAQPSKQQATLQHAERLPVFKDNAVSALVHCNA